MNFFGVFVYSYFKFSANFFICYICKIFMNDNKLLVYLKKNNFGELFAKNLVSKLPIFTVPKTSMLTTDSPKLMQMKDWRRC